MAMSHDQLVSVHLAQKDYTAALESALSTARPARGRLLHLISRACGGPHLDEWVNRCAVDPRAACRQLRFCPSDERAFVRTRAALRYLVDSTTFDADALFAAAAPLFILPELEALIQDGRISPEAVLNVASFDHAPERSVWLSWAARAAYVRGEHIVSLALIRAAARFDRLEHSGTITDGQTVACH